MHKLQKLFYEAGYGDKCRSYSGRGMYGKSCLGVTIKGYDFGDFIADCMLSLDSFPEYDREDLCESFRHLSQDSMGLDMIYYFPNIPYEASHSDDEEDEELEDVLEDDDD